MLIIWVQRYGDFHIPTIACICHSIYHKFGRSTKILVKLPIVILYIAIKLHFLRPSVDSEQPSDLLLQSRRDRSRAIAILKVVGAIGFPDDAIAHRRLQPFRHIVCEGMQHPFGEAHLLIVAIQRTFSRCHTLEVRIHTSVGTMVMGHVRPCKPSQALGAQWALIDITNRVAFSGFLNQ